MFADKVVQQPMWPSYLAGMLIDGRLLRVVRLLRLLHQSLLPAGAGLANPSPASTALAHCL